MHTVYRINMKLGNKRKLYPHAAPLHNVKPSTGGGVYENAYARALARERVCTLYTPPIELKLIIIILVHDAPDVVAGECRGRI